MFSGIVWKILDEKIDDILIELYILFWESTKSILYKILKVW